jgi:A/G-specific adenine glycosylase
MSSASTATLSKPGSSDLLAWYDRHRRRLPWRALPGEIADPYRVWLSEIMLQQTTVAAAGPYFLAFLQRFPDVFALADAPLDDVLRRWAGLGYYARARNLHACAVVVAREHGGVFPGTEAELLALPGIGPYTAAAVAAIAFDEPATVVDGNVERVVSRLFAVEEELPRARPRIRKLAETLTPARRPGDFAQAMMDLGATICTPRRPACPLCPWNESCEARAEGLQESFPRKAGKADRPTRFGHAFWAERTDGAVLLRRRAATGLLGGMVEVPGSAWTETSLGGLPENPPLPSNWQPMGTARHVFSHFALELSVFRATFTKDTPPPEGSWWSLEVEKEALPGVMRKVEKVARSAG